MKYLLSAALLASVALSPIAVRAQPQPQVCLPQPKAVALDLFLRQAALLDQDLTEAAGAPERAAQAAKQVADERAQAVATAIAKQRADDATTAGKPAEPAPATK